MTPSLITSVLKQVPAISKMPCKRITATVEYKGVNFRVTYDWYEERKPTDRDDSGFPEMVEVVKIMHGGDDFTKVFEYDLPEFDELILKEHTNN